MKTRKGSLGFTAVEGILIVVILALIGFVGYKVYSTRSSTDKITSETTTGSQQSAGPSLVPGVINSVSDLDKAQQALDNSDTSSQDNSDTAQLDSQLSNF